jgi:hypothetical protein
LRRLGLACAVSSWLCVACTSLALAQAPIRGGAPDLQIAGGAGIGLDDKIDNNFLGRLRLGALYASEPYWFAGGLTLEAGALAGLAFGGEIEANEFQGWFANLGLNYSQNDQLTGHLGLGYMIVALEYQHGFADRAPSEALLLTARFPVGFWWFTSGREKRALVPPPSTPPNEPIGQGTTQPKTPAAASGELARQPRPLGPTVPDASGSRQPQVTPTVDPRTRERVERGQRALDEAMLAGVRGDYAAQSDALRRAYAAQPDPSLFLRIAAAEIARGKRALAADALQSFLASITVADSASLLAEKPNAQAKLNELIPQLARVRVSLEAAKGNEALAIDGTPQPSALLGYDVWVDPGAHVLTVDSAPTDLMSPAQRTHPLLKQAFEARAGELVRLAVSLPLPAASPAPER